MGILYMENRDRGMEHTEDGILTWSPWSMALVMQQR